MDAVRGASEQATKLYSRYSAGAAEQSNKEMRHLRRSYINGDMEERLPNNVNIYIPRIENEQLVIELDAMGVAVSAGSACHSNGTGGSHVIWAISGDTKRINGSVRFTLGRSTTKKDINYVLKSLPEILKRIRV